MKKLFAPLALVAALAFAGIATAASTDATSVNFTSAVDDSTLVSSDAVSTDANVSPLDDTDEGRACAQRCDENRPRDVESCLKESSNRTIRECNDRAWNNYYKCVDRCNNK